MKSAATLLILFLLCSATAYGQFSPGELSRSHSALEGTSNCISCHEVGKELSGAKCLTCHTPIKKQIDSKHGYHFSISSKTCTTCHKDHLGKDAKTFQFSEKGFQHAETGYKLSGKHAKVECSNCHKTEFIKDADVIKGQQTFAHKTFLGLQTNCNTCHKDRHDGKFNLNCQNCHNETSWTSLVGFDHNATKYALVGKHKPVECNKCHLDLKLGVENVPLVFTTKKFDDCTPCHDGPHREVINNKVCSSCHSVEGWQLARSKPFDHAGLTKYPLVGKHLTTKCQSCHKLETKADTRTAYEKKFFLTFETCESCHADFHKGIFATKYQNHCQTCHTEQGFESSTYSIELHQATRFTLTGAHLATPCGSCHHKKNTSKEKLHQFQFVNLRCETCHEDKHNGQFIVDMKEQSCAACHSVESWKLESFDHSRTEFPLLGKHKGVTCESCHKSAGVNAKLVVQYHGLKTNCESCHQDKHAGQFAELSTTSNTPRSNTTCESCHQAEGWKNLTFNHDKQSRFALTGGHSQVACHSCHKEEMIQSSSVLRFKPLSIDCESCHHQGKEKKLNNG